MILGIYFFAFLLTFARVFGQFAIIIDSESKVPLQNVNIFNESRGVTSDSSGRFFYHDIFDANDTVTFSIIGYRTIYLAISEIPDKIKMESILGPFPHNKLNLVLSDQVYSSKSLVFANPKK